jgi:hypothetical protein
LLVTITLFVAIALLAATAFLSGSVGLTGSFGFRCVSIVSFFILVIEFNDSCAQEPALINENAQ